MSSYLLVHGAWCGGWVWDAVATRLAEAGNRVRAVDRLPSAGPDPAVLGTTADDVDHVRALLAEADEPVVLVGHSYGGVVITELADDPRVRHSAYLAAVWPRRGESLLDVLGGHRLPWLTARDGAVAVVDDARAVGAALCADLDPERTAALHARLVWQAAATFRARSTAPHRAHPTTYLVCAQDAVVPVRVQQRMAARADAVVRLSSAHMAPVSVPGEVAAALARV